jgi:TRAP-type C4-dicarboxylate transport system permease small subunit
MRRFLDGCHRLLTWLMAAMVGILIIPVTLQIISRYTALIPSWIWTEELSRFLFIWMIMLGSMIGVREGTHFVVDVLPQMPPRPNAAIQMLADLGVLVFAGIFLWYGIEFVKFGWNQTSELADLPMPYIFASWPLAGLTWIVFLGEHFFRNFRIAMGRAPA